MKIVVAPDSYKGSLSALAAAQAIRRGIVLASPDAQIELIPLADGGEGFTEAIVTSSAGEMIPAEASDPLGRRRAGFFGWLPSERTAVVEVAAASGLTCLLTSERNPLAASTYGTGELIREALDHGAQTVLVGLGGSATNDGGIGMAQALGYRFFTGNGAEIPPFGNWLDLSRIDASGADPRLKQVRFIAACDVDALLSGERGASHVFGPQKGATPDMVQILDRTLIQLADRLIADMGIDVRNLPGGGAAGGLGAGLVAFCGADLQKGIKLVLNACRFEERLSAADLVITGEGNTDEQTLMGKTAAGVAELASRAGVPVVCLSGGLGQGYRSLRKAGIAALFSVIPHPATLPEAMAQAGRWLEEAAEQVVALYMIGRR